MIAFLLRILRTVMRASLVLAVWVAIGYGVAIGLRAGFNGLPLATLAADDLPGGSALESAASWLASEPLRLADSLNPIGVRYGAGGDHTVCLLGTAGCSEVPLRWPTVDLWMMVPHLADQTWTWLAVGGIVVAVVTVLRRRPG